MVLGFGQYHEPTPQLSIDCWYGVLFASNHVSWPQRKALNSKLCAGNDFKDVVVDPTSVASHARQDQRHLFCCQYSFLIGTFRPRIFSLKVNWHSVETKVLWFVLCSNSYRTMVLFLAQMRPSLQSEFVILRDKIVTNYLYG